MSRYQASTARRLEQLMNERLERILHRMPEGAAKATLAELRRGVGRAPGELPGLWGILLEGLPEELQGAGSEPSEEENALYAALTLFAVHQQGWDLKGSPMHRSGSSFGAAVAALAALAPAGDENARERVERRFTRAATSTELKELSYHLRGLVQMLGANGIPVDWAQTASQLYRWQFPGQTASVRLRWGEDFYRASARGTDNDQRKDETQ